MKPSSIPIVCSVALASMSAAGVSHWWCVRQFTGVIHDETPLRHPTSQLTGILPETKPTVAAILAKTQGQNKSPAVPPGSQKEFYDAMHTLVAEVKNLRSQNLNLVDQMAETNRDLMKLEFRVDTHSESFRPLPTSEERSDTSLDDGPGVLPPRAEPVFPLSHE
ncbi:MAG: hypothetical protein ABI600_00875 [Luteolibacter sp.]